MEISNLSNKEFEVLKEKQKEPKQEYPPQQCCPLEMKERDCPKQRLREVIAIQEKLKECFQLK